MTALILTPRRKTPRRNTAKKAVRRVADAVAKGRQAVADTKRSIDSRISKATGVEFEWVDAVLKLAGATSAIAGRRRIRSVAEKHLHDCGHLTVFQEINERIDCVTGRNHRLKWGHSIEFLPALVKEFGWKAVPGYVVHLTQDLTTVAGIPLIPWARIAKIGLQKLGFKSAVATACVTANLATVVGAVGTALIVIEVGSLGYRLYVAVQEKRGRREFTVVDAVCVTNT
jgi:hypothetical protein